MLCNLWSLLYIIPFLLLGDAYPADIPLVIAPENRCAPYVRSEYRYSPSIEIEIAEIQGLISPYTGHKFTSLRESDVEHIVALSEAHDSGLCSATAEIKKQFAEDLDNLTLAEPRLNRYEKRAKDAGEWLPPDESAQCWFAQKIVKIKMKYGLTVDQNEYDALQRILDSCIMDTALENISWGLLKQVRK